MPKRPFSPRLLRRLLDYNPDTGVFIWKPRSGWMRSSTSGVGRISSWNTRFAGKEAFKQLDQQGYTRGVIWGRTFWAHRVAWAIHYGAWPEQQIDHIDGDRANNKISNLRDVTHTENTRNTGLQKNNSSGCTGVGWHKAQGGWRVRIGHKGKHIYLGKFEKLDDAIAVRKAAEVKYGYHANHGTPRSAFVKEIVLKEIGED